MALGRYKLGPDGAYFDPNDEGPDQASPDQISALQSGSSTPQAPASPTYSTKDPAVPGGADASIPIPPAPSSAPTAPTSAPTSYGYMEGVDTNKLNDPSVTSPKYVASRILASGGSVADAAKAVGGTPIDATRFRLPTGEIIDTRRDEEGANALQWLVLGGGGDSGSGGGPTGSASGTLGSAVSGTANGTTTGSTGNAFTDQVRQLLMQQLGGVTGPINGNDPAIKGEMDAQTASLDRLRKQRRESDAERAAMNGLLNGGQSSGSFEQNVASGFEDEGRQLTGIQAQLFTRELQSRRAQVATLLNMALQSGDSESARALQLTLANMDADLRRAQLSQNQSQWNDQFGLDAAKFGYQKDRDLASFGAGA